MGPYDSTLPSAQDDEEERARRNEGSFLQSLVGDQGMREVSQPELAPRASLAGGSINPMLALLPMFAQMQQQQTPFQQGANAFLNGMAMARGQAPIVQQPPMADPYKLFQMFHTIIKDQQTAQQNADKMELAKAASQRLIDEAASRQQERERRADKEAADYKDQIYEKYGQSEDERIRKWAAGLKIEAGRQRGLTEEQMPSNLLEAFATKRTTPDTVQKATVDFARGYSKEYLQDKYGLNDRDIAEATNPNNLLAQDTILKSKELRAKVDKDTVDAVNAKYPGIGGAIGPFISARAAKMGIPFPDMDPKDRDAVINQAILDQNEDALNKFKQQEGIRQQSHLALTRYSTELQFQKALGLAQAEQKGVFAPIGADKYQWFNQQGDAASGPQLDLNHQEAMKQGLYPLSETEVKRMIALRRGFEILKQMRNTGEQLDKAGMWVTSPGPKGVLEGANAWWQYYAGNPNEQKIRTEAGVETLPGNKTLLRNLEQQKTDMIVLDRAMDALGIRAMKGIEPQFAAMSPSGGKPAYDRVLGQVEAALRSQAAASKTPGMFEVVPRVFPDPTKQIGTEGSQFFGPKSPITKQQYMQLRSMGKTDEQIRASYEVMP